jgi:hypothetical protein
MQIICVTAQDFYGRDVSNPVHLTVDTTMTNNEMAIQVRHSLRPASASGFRLRGDDNINR